MKNTEDDEYHNFSEPLLGNDDENENPDETSNKENQNHNECEPKRSACSWMCCWKSKLTNASENDEDECIDDDISSFQPLGSIAESSHGSCVPLVIKNKIIPKIHVSNQSSTHTGNGLELEDDFDYSVIQNVQIDPFKPRSEQKYSVSV